MNTGDVFDEHLGVIAALRDNYARHDDSNTIHELLAVQAEIASLLNRREDNAKSSIQALSSKVEDARIKATYPEKEDAHGARLREVEDNIAASKQHATQLTSQLQALKVQRQGIEAGMQEVDLRQTHVDHMALEDEPRIRHQLSLYAHVSKISWRFDQPDRVAGTVSDPEHADMHAFDMHADTPPLEVANRLWDLMQEAS